MRPFFLAADRQKALDAEARSWLKTPFFPNAASKGFGVGCVNLVHEIFAAPSVAAVPRLEIPKYELDRGHHSTRSQLLEFLMNEPALKGRLVFVPLQARRLPGDLLALVSGHLDHHLAVCVLHGDIIHAVDPRGVIATQETEQEVASRILYVLRLMEVTS